MKLITLNEQEVALAEYMGKKKYRWCRKNNAKGTWVGGRGEESDVQAFGAELAFCKAYNLYPDTVCEPGAYDAILRSGLTVDVKNTHRPSGHLCCKKGTASEADLYCLVIGEIPDFRIVGIATREKVHQSTLSLGEGPENWSLAQDELDPVETWITQE